jgi:glutathionyl-hydroquinone reductase
VVRFDVAYYTIFNCNWKQIRSDYPNVHRWVRELYWEVDEEAKGALKSTTNFEIVSWSLMLDWEYGLVLKANILL